MVEGCPVYSKMICVGKPSGQSPWELCRSKIHGGQFWRRSSERLRQVWSASALLDFSGSSPNWLHNLTLPSHTRKFSYAPLLEFRSSAIIDLLPQDATLAESKVFSSNGRNGSPLMQSRSNFIYAYSGQSIGPAREWSSPQRRHTKIRADRISNRPSKETSELWEDMDRDGIEDSSTWDSNVETVRRHRSKRKYSPAPEVQEARSSQQERDGVSQRNKWDYDSEPEYGDEPKGFPTWQWWGNNDEEENEEEEDEDPSWFSWLNPDIKDGFMLLRWGLPAAFVLCTAVLPFMIGNPLMLFFGFSIFPSAVKLLNPVRKKVVHSVANFFETWSPEPKKRRSRPVATNGRPRYSDAKNNYGSPRASSRSYGGPDYEQGVRPGRAGTNRLGGWEDLVEHRDTVKAETKWPLQKQPKMKRKLVKRDRPLIIRFLLALFPFLQRWGGLL